ncbi:MAG: SPOR domain-containing protein [Ignavibacterium sp.]|nr:SPOR domain-containing protein [Ignavibacterium sp.]
MVLKYNFSVYRKYVPIWVVFFLIVTNTFNFAQEYNIVPMLKKIESGGVEEVRTEVKSLLNNYPNDPSIQFVDAITTENAEQAVSKYISIFQKSPQSKYADAALFRAYSFYYAAGSYRKAQEYLFKLQKDYPSSPYLKSAERNIPLVEDNEANLSSDKPEPKTELTRSSATNYNFLIQAGAFTNFSNAISLKNDLEDTGLSVEINEKTVGGTLFYVVLAGKFEDKNSALKASDKINIEFRLDSKVIPITK